MRLDELADIVVGQIMTRVITAPGEAGTVQRQLAPKAIAKGVVIDSNISEVVVAKKVVGEKVTKEGDVIMKLSTPYEAAYITKKHEGLVIPSFCAAIRSKGSVDPGFLCAVINSEYFTEQIKFKTAGTVLPMVKISDLRSIEIPVVSDEKMKAIGTEYMISCQKLVLLDQMIKNEQKIMNNRVLKGLLEDEDEG